MRVAGFEFARGDHVVLWWVGSEARRAAVCSSWEQTRAAFDRVVRVLPATAASAQTIQTSLGCLDDPGQPLVVHSRVVDDLVGLVRPFTVGSVAGAALVFTAAVDAGALRLPLLSTDATALRAVTHALDARAGRELPWQTFDVDHGSGSLEHALKARRATQRGLKTRAQPASPHARSRPT